MSKVKIYIVAVWSPDYDGSQLFTFTNETNRAGFISDIESDDPRITWATAEDTVDEQHIQEAAS
jgi:hypothetical protein|tara:strand:- start:574 stop:765 length:192 start_codon:yes stop_codon:yes gene_type:complete